MGLPPELMGVMAYRTAMAWQRTDDPTKVKPWFLRDSPGFGIVPELQPSPREAVMSCPQQARQRPATMRRPQPMRLAGNSFQGAPPR
jgi:hypothetical protein